MHPVRLTFLLARRPALLAGLSAVLVFGCAPNQDDDSAPPEPPSTQSDVDHTVDRPRSAEPRSYDFHRETSESFGAVNPPHAVKILALSDRVELELGRGPATWKTAIRALAIGDGDRMERIGRGTLSHRDGRLENRRDGLVEWFENGSEGLEHGFVVQEGSSGAATQLVIDVAFDGARLRQIDDRTIALASDDGTAGYRYHRLLAWDARRLHLPSRMELHGSRDAPLVRLVVDVEEATFPVTIDPVVTEEEKMLASDGAAGDRLGASIASTQELAVLGAPQHDGAATDAGAAYVYGRDTGGADTWGENQTLVASDAEAGDNFGAAVAVAGSTIVVGTPLDDDGEAEAGAAYVFDDTGSGFTEVAKLTPSDPYASGLFGSAVATDGDLVVVGAPGTDGRGAAYAFHRNTGGTGQFGQVKKFVGSDTAMADAFGRSIALWGETAVVGAPSATRSSLDDAGVAYVFGANVGNGWGEVAILLPAAGSTAAEQFGESVAIDQSRAVVGAPGASTDTGAAYVFGKDEGGTDAWGQIKRINAAGGSPGDRFGESVGLHLPFAVVGTPGHDIPGDIVNPLRQDAGALFVFDQDFSGPDSWAQIKKQTAADAAPSDRFGASIGLHVGTATAGTPGDDDNGSAAGSGYVVRINSPPVASDDSYQASQGQTLNIGAPGVLGNDDDVNGDPLTAVLDSGPTDGTLTLDSDGSFAYTSDGTFSGTDSFTYIASDGTELSGVATVTIDVSDTDASPNALDDSATTDEDTLVSIDVLANDSDPEGANLTLTFASDPANGTTAISGDEIEYTPDPDFNGTDTFYYRVSDGNTTATANVTVDVTPVNDDPVALDDSYNTAEDVAITVNPMDNDSDVDGDVLTITNVSMPGIGTAAIVSNGTQVEYTPDPDVSGMDSFTYTIGDGSGGAATATISVAISSIQDPPVANDDTATTDENSPVLIDVLANDTDGDGDPLSISSVDDPPNGTAVIVGDQIEYTPDTAFFGTDSFDYTISDGIVSFASATVTVTVNGIDFPPEFVLPTPAGTVPASVTETVEFTVAATDIDGDDVTLGVFNLPANAVFDPSTGMFSWPTEIVDGGTHVITFTASDGTNTTMKEITVELSFEDADADGVPDPVERMHGLDTTTPDSDGDTIADIDEIGDLRAPWDTDGDGTIDALDEDSDDDGLSDAGEAGDDDLATPPIDTDGDGTPDFRDTDSDGDGTLDAMDNCVRTPNPDQTDTDGDGRGDACEIDIDGDGLNNMAEEPIGLDPMNPDTDGDTISDGDEVGDVDAPVDTDGDGTIDALDEDSDDDGIPDADEAGDDDIATEPVDTDRDGIADFRDLDSDNDSVPDGIDNCRTVVNPDQTDFDGNGVGDACEGPIDADGDGVEDPDDNCPDAANPDQSDIDEDGLGDVCDDDVDGDGIPNAEDNCPTVPNPDQENNGDDAEGDACDNDDDDDGVRNEQDNCPDTPNPDQADEDGDGDGDACDPAVTPPPEDDTPEDDGGCCRTVSSTRSPAPGLLLLLAALLAGRRRRAPSRAGKSRPVMD